MSKHDKPIPIPAITVKGWDAGIVTVDGKQRVLVQIVVADDGMSFLCTFSLDEFATFAAYMHATSEAITDNDRETRQ